jgi:hypothetical protein
MRKPPDFEEFRLGVPTSYPAPLDCLLMGANLARRKAGILQFQCDSDECRGAQLRGVFLALDLGRKDGTLPVDVTDPEVVQFLADLVVRINAGTEEWEAKRSEKGAEDSLVYDDTSWDDEEEDEDDED